MNPNIPIRNLAPPPPKKENPILTYGVPVVLLAALGVAGYFGYGWYQDRQAKAREAESTAAAAAQAQSISNHQATAEAAAEAAANAVVPPVWTLDLDTIKPSQGRVNGRISGAPFVAEMARVDAIGTAQVLRFIQGQMVSPDGAILVYLHLKPGEQLGGRRLTISKEMKGSGVPQVTKLWKANPASPLQVKNFTSGYALKLELGVTTNDVVPGTIFLALPDREQSVIAGAFQAATGSGLAPAAAPQAAEVMPPTAPAPAQTKAKRTRKR